MRTRNHLALLLATSALVTSAAGVWPAAARGDILADVPARLRQALPAAPDQCTPQRTAALARICGQAVDSAAERTWALGEATAADSLPAVAQLLAAAAGAEQALQQLLPIRTKFTDSPRGDPRREQVRQYLNMVQTLIDASGRLQYQLRDAVDNATYTLASDIPRLHQLIDMLTKYRSEPGAKMTAFVLFDPDPASGLKPYPPPTRAKVLQLIAAARSVDSLPDLARFLKQRNVDAGLRLTAADVVRYIGLPQDPHPQQDPSITAPVLSVAELTRIVQRAQLPASADPKLTELRQQLLDWLHVRATRGVTEDTLHVGNIEVAPGDWFLMRNPSPFNMFTDLAPGLFTHVGIVTAITDDEGVRRFVVADLPERGDRVPATNVDAYVGTTLNYFFLRHQDAEINRKMGAAAADTIGNASQFDLLFRTDRVLQYKGKSLKNARIHTYCAGYLLLCAQHTGAPRSEFFPLQEFSPSQLCQQNLAKLGVQLGDNYISPTGPLFSPRHKIVGRRTPLYSPEREIQEAVFDHFGISMARCPLQPSETALQALRTKVAGLSRYNPWLARALAAANNVSPQIDLEAAAKAAAVVESLDEIAYRASDDFRLAWLTLQTTERELIEEIGTRNLAKSQAMRQQHAELLRSLDSGDATPRQVRVALVEFYKQQGREQLNRRFFPTQASP